MDIGEDKANQQKNSLDVVMLFHLITRSARANTLGGIVMPICFAVLRLITNSNFVGPFDW
jgi:hypothetical protein